MSVVTDVADIPRSVWNRKQANKSTPIFPILVLDLDHNYMLDEIMYIDQIEFNRQIDIDDKSYNNRK